MALIKNKNNVALLLIIIGAIIFFVFIMPMVDKNDNEEIKEKFDSSNASIALVNTNVVKIDNNKCSRDCCGLSQWPVPDELLPKSIPKDELKEYIPTNFSCNFGNNTGSGCVCMTKSDSNYLTNRGNVVN
jgi:hypothetical protein